jgi:hypothetical protein
VRSWSSAWGGERAAPADDTAWGCGATASTRLIHSDPESKRNAGEDEAYVRRQSLASVQTSVTEWIFSPFHKSLFRASGIGLLTIFLITTISALYPRPNLGQPTAVLNLTNQILDQSPLLCLALLLLLLSLTDQVLGLWGPEERPRQGIRDRLLVRGRVLVGLVAMLYLALIPITLTQTQALKNVSDRVLNQRIRIVESQLAPISEQLNSGSQNATSLAALKDRNPWIGKADINTLDELRVAVRKIKKNAGIYQETMRSSGHRKLLMQSLKLCSLATIYAGLTGYLWFHWPKPTLARSISKKAKHPGLGYDY